MSDLPTTPVAQALHASPGSSLRKERGAIAAQVSSPLDGQGERVCVRERERKQLFNSPGLRYMPDTEAEVRRTTTQVRHLSEVQA